MANLFSDLLTARDAQGIITGPGTYAGASIITRAFINLTANPSASDTIMMLDLPSNAKPSSLFLYNDDIGDNSVVDFGIYAGGAFIDTNLSLTEYAKDAVINQNAFDNGSGDLNNAHRNVHIDLRFQATGSASSLDRIDDVMWQLAGLNSDPGVDMRIGIFIGTNFANFLAGNIALISEYTVK